MAKTRSPMIDRLAFAPHTNPVGFQAAFAAAQALAPEANLGLVGADDTHVWFQVAGNGAPMKVEIDQSWPRFTA